MPKGKKFDAAEKHFQKKEKQYQERIETLYNEIKNLRDNSLFKDNEIKKLSEENLKMLTKIQMMEQHQCSSEQADKLIEEEERALNAVELFGSLSKFASGLYR